MNNLPPSDVQSTNTVNQVKMQLNLQNMSKQNEHVMPTVMGGQDSDVAVSPSPDRKVWVQNKAINMPHDTSKLRGMAVRKTPMAGHNVGLSNTPVYDKIGGPKFESNISLEFGSRVEEFNTGEHNNTAVQFEKKLLPKVSP